MRRQYRPPDPVMCRHRKPFGSRFVKRRIGGHNRNCGVAQRRHSCGLFGADRISQASRRIGPQAAKFLVQLKRSGPKMPRFGGGHIANRVDRDQRANGCPAVQHQRRRPQTAFQRSSQRPGSRPDAAKIKIIHRGGKRPSPQIGIGIIIPVFLTTIEQIGQDRRRHQWHMQPTQRKTTPLGTQPRHNTACRIQTKRRAPRQNKCINGLHGFVRLQQIRVPGAWRSAHDRIRSSKWRSPHQNRTARFQRCVLRVAHREPRDIRDQIACARNHHQMQRPPSTRRQTPVIILASSEHR